MSLACVVLAAGLGKRMNSTLPKVLHRLCGSPMLQYVIDAIEKLKPDKKIIVVGKHYEEIKSDVYGRGVSYVIQKEPRGTGDALLRAGEALNDFKGNVLVLNGDMPLITTHTLKKHLNAFKKNMDAVSVLSFLAEDPSSYGRIVRERPGRVIRIIEDKDATSEQKKIKEVNSGVYVIRPEVMNLLTRIRPNKANGEYYLTDILEIASKEGLKTGVYCAGSEMELMGVNTGLELLRAEGIIKGRIISNLVEKGVNFIDTASVHIHAGVNISKDTVIYPNVYLEGNTKIGRGCKIYPNVRIKNSTIGDNAIIKDSSVIEDSDVRQSAHIGPFAHLRPGSTIGTYARIGNFVEVKKSVIGERTKASHLSYIGDAVVGRDVNIGAGTITCNYDGSKKHKTVIKDGVFIGSDTQLVAPVCIGKGAYVGAGSTITKDVPSMSLAVSRAEQRNIKGWAAKKQLKVRSSELIVKKGRNKR